MSASGIAPERLLVDATQISNFVHTLFRYAPLDRQKAFVSLRSFPHQKDAKPLIIKGVRVGESGLEPLIKAAVDVAQRTADGIVPGVFSPPICLFGHHYSAEGAHLLVGLTLSVELDENPSGGRRRLESVLGPATVVVASGGTWTDPTTGEIQDKLHVHWRLSEPTMERADHDQLYHARALAMRLVSADPTGVPVVHCLKWPGSWNRKTVPRMSRIISMNEDADLHLVDAIEMLQDAGAETGINERSDRPAVSGEPQQHPRLVAEWMAAIPNADAGYNDWIAYGYRSWRAMGGEPGFDVWEAWSKKSAKYDAGETEAVWRRICAACANPNAPRKGGAGTICRLAKQAGWVWTPAARELQKEFRQRQGAPEYDGCSDAGPLGDDPPIAPSASEWAQIDAAAEDEAASAKEWDGESHRAALRDLLSIDAWVDRDIPEPDRLLGDLLTTTTRVFLVGRTGLGKTLLGMAIAAGAASGQGFLNWRSARPARVLYLDGEMPAELIKPRARDAVRRLGGAPIPPHNLLIFGRDIEKQAREVLPSLPPFAPLNTDSGRSFLLALLDKIGGVDLVIFDNVMSLISGDQKDEVPWSETLELVAALTDRRVGQLWLDHTGHNSDRQYGSSTKSWRFDAVGVMTPLEGQSDPKATSFTLSFDHPGKARRRTPDNWNEFAAQTIRLSDDRWTSDAAGGQRKLKDVRPSRKIFHDAMLDTIAAGNTAGRGQVCRAAWEAECVRRGLMQAKSVCTEPESKRTQDFRRAVYDLQAAEWIGCDGDTFTDLTRPYAGH